MSVVLYHTWTCHVIQRDRLYNRTCPATRRGVFGILILVTFATRLAKVKPGEFEEGDLASR